MSEIFYHSDWHFNHEFVAKDRGYESAEAHDEELIDNINRHTSKRDTIWVLGDAFMGSVTEGLKQCARINATTHLILGNHDAAHPLHRGSHGKVRRFLEVFESVSLAEQHRIDGQKVMLSHFPYDGDHDDRDDRYSEWRLRDQGLPLIHGHLHGSRFIAPRQVNVGVDHWPVPAYRDLVMEHLARSGVLD